MTTVDRDLTAFLHEQMPFSAELNLLAVRAGPDEVVAVAAWDDRFCTVAGALHGGYLMALADSVGAACAAFNLPTEATTSTIESKTNFFRPVGAGTVTIAATPLHVGHTVIVVSTDIVDGDGLLVARTVQSQIVVQPRED